MKGNNPALSPIRVFREVVFIHYRKTVEELKKLCTPGPPPGPPAQTGVPLKEEEKALVDRMTRLGVKDEEEDRKKPETSKQPEGKEDVKKDAKKGDIKKEDENSGADWTDLNPDEDADNEVDNEVDKAQP